MLKQGNVSNTSRGRRFSTKRAEARTATRASKRTTTATATRPTSVSEVEVEIVSPQAVVDEEKGEETGEESDGQKGELERLDDVQRYAFDEMNLVELPFALLTDAKDLGKQSPKEMPLGPGGEECLVAGGRGNLPTALAERVILSLLWLTQKTNQFKEPTVRFSLRRLIHEYMYPDRADNNRAGGAFYKRVEDELHRIAATRIITSRWYDRELKKLTQMDASIIDYIQVIEEGGRNKARVMEVRWGAKLFKSIQDRYTKTIDVRTILQIDRPMDLRFYRWLDRQLALKSSQQVRCQQFAKYKLLMRGQKIDRGGRTASSYIVRKLTEALERLDSVGFSVRMTVDEATPDYLLTFARTTAKHNEAFQVDDAAELVREFQHLAHGLPKDAARRRIAAPDRNEAARWLEDYDLDHAKKLVKQCIQLHNKSSRREEPIFRFKGLTLYEAKALADSERKHGGAAKEISAKGKNQQREQAWEQYRDTQIAKAQEEAGKTGIREIEKEARAALDKEYAGTRFQPPPAVVSTLVKAAAEKRLLEKVGAMDQEAFFEEWAG